MHVVARPPLSAVQRAHTPAVRLRRLLHPRLTPVAAEPAAESLHTTAACATAAGLTADCATTAISSQHSAAHSGATLAAVALVATARVRAHPRVQQHVPQ